MNFSGNDISKKLFKKAALIGLSFFCCGVINSISFFASSTLSSLPEIVANHISVLTKDDVLGRSNISICDESGLLAINEYHVRMMSYIGKNNSIFGTYPDLCINTIKNEKQDSSIENVNVFGLTNYGDGYVYGTTDIPYGATIIEGEFSPTNPLFLDDSSTFGCIISESVKNSLFQVSDSAIGKTITLNYKDAKAEFSIIAVAKDSSLCSNYNKAPFIIANFAILQKLNEGKCCLKLRLEDNYYTNYSIFHIFFSHVYIKGYSMDKLLLDFGDDYLNSFVYSFAAKELEQNNMSFLIVISLALELTNAFAFAFIFSRNHITATAARVTFIAFSSLLVSYILSLCFNHHYFNYAYLNTRASIITIVVFINVIFFSLGLFLFSRIFKEKKNTIAIYRCKIDI